MKVKIDDIIVGERVREELGDLTKLAESLKKHGLIHPIVIDEDMRLIAGERRLEAAKMIGWNEIDVVYRTQLTERQKRILELEENLHRKDFSLSEYEKSKRLVELAELKAEELRKRPTDNQIMPTPGKKSGRGRPNCNSHNFDLPWLIMVTANILQNMAESCQAKSTLAGGCFYRSYFLCSS